MLRRPIASLLVALLWTSSVMAAGGDVRTWTNADGRQIEAELLAVRAGFVDIRLASNLRKYTYPITKLSLMDQQFLKGVAPGVVTKVEDGGEGSGDDGSSRIWTNYEGRQIRARLLSMDHESNSVDVLLLKNLRKYTYPIDGLSDADQEYLKSIEIASVAMAVADSQTGNTAPADTLALNPGANLVALQAPQGRIAQWTQDYDAALDEAKRLGLPVLMLFTGSDWSAYCKHFREEVFENGDFREFADANLVLLMIDFPKEIQQPKELADRNRRLGEQFLVTGYPTVVILGPNGEKLGTPRRNYTPGVYIRNITDLLERKGFKLAEKAIASE